MEETQRYVQAGTWAWTKPARAVTVKVELKGGRGEPGNGPAGGRGGYPTMTSNGMMAGGGGAGGGSWPPGSPGAEGGEGALVEKTFDAGDLPDYLEVRVGRGGYAVITAVLPDTEGGASGER